MSNENYKGNIELISGLIQKNKGIFPLMEANAVAVYEEDGSEVRLDEKLRQLKESSSISQEALNGIKEQVFLDERHTKLSTQVEKNSTAINATGTGLLDRMTAVEGKLDEGDNKELKLQFEEKESMLYLFTGDTLIKPGGDQETNVISSTGITGGGGAGASLNYAIALKQLDGNNLTFLNNNTPKIQYRAVFTDTSAEEGEDNLVSQNLNFKMTVTLPSGAKNVYTFQGMSNTDLEYDLTELLSSQAGLILGDHGITLTVSYTQEVENQGEMVPITIQSTKKWTVKITEMYLTSSFDDASVREADVPFSVTVYGDLNKTIHYNFNGTEDWKTVEAPMSNYDYSIVIPKQPHGSYSLEVYLSATINKETITSDSLLFDIMFKEDGNSAPIIRAVPASKKGQQYSNLAIEYSVYSPNSLMSDVVLAADGKVVSSLKVDRSEQTWNYKSNTEGKKNLTITCGETIKTLEIEIEKIPYTIEPVTAGLELDFSPQGRTNQDADKEIFKNNVYDGEGNEKPLTWTLSENFDWVNGGWKVDENDDSYFCIKAGTTATINYLLFNDPYTLTGANKAKGNGKEFKVIFKTTNVANADTTWLTCLANPETGSEVGIQMDAHAAYIKGSSGENLKIPYSEDDKIEFDMNIVPITYNKEGTVDLTVQDIPMVITYEDGTPARPLVLANDTTTFKQQNAVPITIGSPYCDVHIYRMKAYSTYLSEKNILSNFIADAPNGEEMIARYTRNQIYDAKTGKLTPESFAAACPHMRVLKISAPRFTNDKKDKVLETHIDMIYKNGDPVLDNWRAEYARHNGQGTSSNAYGYAGRNLELSLKEKETLRYKITRPEGVYNEKGKLQVYGTIIDGKQDFFLDEALEQKVEDASTVAEITTIPGTTIILGDGSTVDDDGNKIKKVSLTRDSYPTNYFNIKVNIASSEQANNALLQKRFDRYLPYQAYSSSRDERIKNTMNFYNCVIFIQERNEDLTTHQEFNDNNWHFYSIGNIGDSKKTDDTRTSDPDDKTEFCVEIMDWNRELSAFPQDTKVQANVDKYTIKDENSNVIGYKFITEENLVNNILYEKDYSLKTYQEQDAEGTWVSYGYKVSEDEIIDTENLNKYYVDILEQDDYSEDYTYGFRYVNDEEDEEQIAAAKAQWNLIYRFITRDNYYDDRRADENGKWLEDPAKVEAWKSEFEDWFIKDAAFYYYLFTLRYTMVDNRAKNSFWHWGKCLDGKYRVDFWDYDNDTAFGIDNTGKFTMEYGVEDHDVNEGGAAHFRAHNSTFFVRVADYFANELITYYKDKLENADPTVFSSTSLIKEFDDWQSEFPEEVWRLQYERIYKRTYVGGYGSIWDNAVNPTQIKKSADPQFLTEMMNGKKKYHRRQFERNQDVYMSSKFFGQTNFQDVITLRGGGDMDPSKFIVKPNGDITITPYLNMYINAGPENNKFLHHVKVKAGESVTLKYPTKALEFNYIWGGSYLQSLGDLSPMYLRVAKLGQGQRMKQLILGNKTEGYNNPNLDNVEITSNNKLLEELDVRNMSNLTKNIPIDTISSLRKLYAQGTSYQTVKFANNGLIEEAYLPATIDTIIAINLYYLQTLELDGYEKLEKLLIDGCPRINDSGRVLDLLTQATNLKRIRVTNVNWHLSDSTLLNRLVKCAGIGDDNSSDVEQSVLTGRVELDSIRESEIPLFKAAWPKLELIYREEDVIPQFTVNFWRDKENPGEAPIFSKLFDEMHQLTKADDPSQQLIEEGLLYRESTAQYDYTFKAWTPNFTGYVSKNLDFYGTFNQIDRYYDVSWYNDERGTIISDVDGNKATVRVKYGTAAVYNEAQFGIPAKNTAAADNKYHLFSGWDKATGYITGDTKVYPIWETSTPNVPEGTASEDLTPAQINALSNITNGLNSFIDTGDRIKLQTGYMPDYGGIVLIDKPVVFNGSGENVIQTDYKLFDEDKSFVLAIDFETHMPGSGTSTLVSCGGASGGKGFRIYSLNSATQKEKYPQIEWKQTSSKQIGFNDPSAQRTCRDICVIKHIKGDPNLYVFVNDRKSLAPVKKETIVGGQTGTLSHYLCFGAQSTEAGYSSSNYGTGIIHYAKLWFNDLDDAECSKICSWIYEELTFSNCGSQIYKTPAYGDNGTIYEGESYVGMSFVADNLLDLKSAYDANSNYDGGWDVSDLRNWLNTKVFAGLSMPWKQIIRPTAIKSLYGWTSAGSNNKPSINKRVTVTEDKLYIPAVAEVNSFASGHYLLEKSNNIYAVFPEQEDRIRNYSTGEKDAWWLRTPADSSYSAEEMVMPNGEIRTFWEDKDDGTQYNAYKSNENGVIFGFSIGEVM